MDFDCKWDTVPVVFVVANIFLQYYAPLPYKKHRIFAKLYKQWKRSVHA